MLCVPWYNAGQQVIFRKIKEALFFVGPLGLMIMFTRRTFHLALEPLPCVLVFAFPGPPT
jgi:hypothetical protein